MPKYTSSALLLSLCPSIALSNGFHGTAVAKALNLAEPVLTKGSDIYAKLHDTIVKEPFYSSLYTKVDSTLSSALTSTYATKAKDVVYPVVAPVYDPVASNFAKSKYMGQLQAHIKPKTA
jgi:hypothetical protein